MGTIPTSSTSKPGSLASLILSRFPRTRLTSLYSDFRPQLTINPEGYHANITAWTSLLSDATKYRLIPGSPDTLVLHTGPGLIDALTIEKCGRPLAVGVALNEAVAMKHFIQQSAFLTQPASIYARSILSSIGGYLWSYLSSPSRPPSTTVPTETYIVVKNVEEAARDVLAHFRDILAQSGNNRFALLWTIEDFTEEFSNQGEEFSENDVSVLLKYLERDLREITVSGNVIKFKSPSAVLQAVDSTDSTLASLKHTIRSLHTSLEHLTATSNNLHQLVLKSLSQKNKTSASRHLRSKKIVDATITSRSTSLGQLESLLLNITQAVDNVELVNLLESGGKALNDLNKQTGGVERVEEVMETLREAREGAEEISAAIGRVGEERMAEIGVEEEDVERELEEMLEQEEERERKTKEEEEKERQRVLDGERAAELARKEAEGLARSLDALSVHEEEQVGKVTISQQRQEREREYA